MNTASRFAPLTVGLTLAAFALAGCSVSVSAPTSTPGADTSNASPATGAAGGEADAGGSETGVAPAVGTVDDETMASLQRSAWASYVTQNLVCEDGSLDLARNADATVVDITGDCAEVTIEAHAGTILLGDVGHLTVIGDGITVIAHSIDEITMASGAHTNVVGWEQGTPTITDDGINSVLTPIS